MKSMKNRAAVILAGGKARRYEGRIKGLIRLPGGLTIIDRLIREITSAGIDKIFISANDAEVYEQTGLEIMMDVRPGNGPLSGIESALLHLEGRYENILFMPGDLPGITSAEIMMLFEASDASPDRIVAAVTGKKIWHPLCAVIRDGSAVHNGVRDGISRAIDEGRKSVHLLWQELDAVPVQFGDMAPFFNINSAGDLDDWLKTGNKESKEVCHGSENQDSGNHA
jgi:molybdenum cofactor guanylyltransferase